MRADPERLAGQLTLLSSTDAEERIDAAEQLGDWWRHLDHDQVVTVARGLAAAVAAESDTAATEAELHELIELANSRSYTRDDLPPLPGVAENPSMLTMKSTQKSLRRHSAPCSEVDTHDYTE